MPGTANTCQAAFTGKRTGIRVFGDGADRWVASRPLWSQHTYSITGVDDKGVIAKTSQWARNWDVAGLNNFRMNVQGKVSPSAAGDVTAQGGSKGTGVCQGNMVQLSTSICNRGTAPVVDGTPISFYEGSQLLCTALTKEALSPGGCTVVSCAGPLSQSGTHTVTIAADDNGSGSGQTSECNEGNNRADMSFTC